MGKSGRDLQDLSYARLAREASWIRLGRALGGRTLLFLIARVLYHLRVVGEENIPTQGACLFPFNHVSHPADFLVSAVIGRHRSDVRTMARQGFEGDNEARRFFDGVGRGAADERFLLAYTGRGHSAGELMRGLRVLQQGGAISVAAEGESTWDGRLQYPLARGTAWLAVRSGAAVVPVVSKGGYDLRPRWSTRGMRFTGRLSIRVGEPFPVSPEPVARVSDAAVQEANETIWKAMAALLEPPL